MASCDSGPATSRPARSTAPPIRMAPSSFADPALASAPLRPPRRALIAAAALAIVLAGAVAALVLRPGGEHAPARLHTAAFSVVVPDGWRAARPADLRSVPGAPAAMLRRADGRGVVVVPPRPAP